MQIGRQRPLFRVDDPVDVAAVTDRPVLPTLTPGHVGPDRVVGMIAGFDPPEGEAAHNTAERHWFAVVGALGDPAAHRRVAGQPEHPNQQLTRLLDWFFCLLKAETTGVYAFGPGTSGQHDTAVDVVSHRLRPISE